MKYAICIPSKGRPTQCVTVKNFKSDNIFLFVESSEYSDYVKENKEVNVIDICKKVDTIGHKRQCILEWCIKNKVEYCFMLDDNIEEFLVREGFTEAGHPKLKSVNNFKQFIKDSIKTIEENGLAQMGISFKPSNWTGDSVLSVRKRCWGCFILNISKVKGRVEFDKVLKSSEDFDFGISLLKKGLINGMYYKYAFYKKMGSSVYSGGNREAYDLDVTKKQTEYIESKHPGYCKKFLHEKHGMWEIKVSWHKIKSKIEHNWW